MNDTNLKPTNNVYTVRLRSLNRYTTSRNAKSIPSVRGSCIARIYYRLPARNNRPRHRQRIRADGGSANGYRIEYAIAANAVAAASRPQSSDARA